MPTPDPDPLAAIRAGEPLEYSYDIYGTGRVRYVVRWDPADDTFVEELTEWDLGGNVYTGQTRIDEPAARRHAEQSERD